MTTVLAVLVLGPSLTGTFFQGNGMGVNHTLTFQGDGKVKFRFDGCFGGATSEGSFLVHGDRLTLSLKAHDSFKQPGFFYIAKWATETFLISDAEMPSFIYKVRHGWKGTNKRYGFGDFFTTNFDRTSAKPSNALPGSPVLPEPYQKLSTNNFTAILTKSANKSSWQINLGTNNGVWNGSVFSDTKKVANRFLVVDSKFSQAIVLPLMGSKIVPGQVLVPSTAPFETQIFSDLAVSQYKKKPTN